MAVNSLKGSKRGTSKSARYFQDPKNIAQKKKKLAYDKEFQKKKKQVKKRVETNKFNRDQGTYGNLDNKDASHTSNGKLVQEHFSKNRSRQGRGGKSTLLKIKKKK